MLLPQRALILDCIAHINTGLRATPSSQLGIQPGYHALLHCHQGCALRALVILTQPLAREERGLKQTTALLKAGDELMGTGPWDG